MNNNSNNKKNDTNNAENAKLKKKYNRKNARIIGNQLTFDESLNNCILLNYNEEEAHKLPYQLYNTIPENLSYWKLFKYRHAIKSYIDYQTNIYAKTFVERKILKETKQVLIYIVSLLFN